MYLIYVIYYMVESEHMEAMRLAFCLQDSYGDRVSSCSGILSRNPWKLIVTHQAISHVHAVGYFACKQNQNEGKLKLISVEERRTR